MKKALRQYHQDHFRNAMAGAARIYLVGSDELARGVVKVRDLGSGEERDEPLLP